MKCRTSQVAVCRKTRPGKEDSKHSRHIEVGGEAQRIKEKMARSKVREVMRQSSSGIVHCGKDCNLRNRPLLPLYVSNSLMLTPESCSIQTLWTKDQERAGSHRTSQMTVPGSRVMDVVQKFFFKKKWLGGINTASITRKTEMEKPAPVGTSPHFPNHITFYSNCTAWQLFECL